MPALVVDELGIEPGEQTTALHRRILAGESWSRGDVTPVSRW